MTDVRPSRALFNSALFAVAAFLSFSLAFLACRGDNAAKERESLQKEIEMARDSLTLLRERYKILVDSIRIPIVWPKPKDAKPYNACGDSNECNYIKPLIPLFQERLDSLHRRLKELPPPK